MDRESEFNVAKGEIGAIGLRDYCPIFYADTIHFGGGPIIPLHVVRNTLQPSSLSPLYKSLSTSSRSSHTRKTKVLVIDRVWCRLVSDPEPHGGPSMSESTLSSTYQGTHRTVHGQDANPSQNRLFQVLCQPADLRSPANWTSKWLLVVRDFSFIRKSLSVKRLLVLV